MTYVSDGHALTDTTVDCCWLVYYWQVAGESTVAELLQCAQAKALPRTLSVNSVIPAVSIDAVELNTYCCLKDSDSSTKGADEDALDVNPILVTAADVISTSSSSGGGGAVSSDSPEQLPAEDLPAVQPATTALQLQPDRPISPTAARIGVTGTSVEELGKESDAGWSSCQASKGKKVRSQAVQPLAMWAGPARMSGDDLH
jgi:hypothetical protein